MLKIKLTSWDNSLFNMNEPEPIVRKRTDIAGFKELHWLVIGKLNMLTLRVTRSITLEENNQLYTEICEVIKQLIDTVIELSEQLHDYKDKEEQSLLKSNNPGYIICPECKKEFEKRYSRVYCSDECRIRHYSPKPQETPAEIIQCLQCQKEFTKKKRQKFCSPECRILYNNSLQKPNRHKRYVEDEEEMSALAADTFKREPIILPEAKPEPDGKRCIYIPSGYTMCHNLKCKRVFKPIKLEHFCSESCENAHRETNKVKGIFVKN